MILGLLPLLKYVTLFHAIQHTYLTVTTAGINPSNDISVYWINEERSVSRREWMSNHLNVKNLINYRIKSMTPSDLRFADGLNLTLVENHNISSLNWNGMKKRSSGVNIEGIFPGRSTITMSELSCTSSHLIAMHTAIYSNNTNRYAIISEDDIELAYHINFTELIRSAPNNFTILQLSTVNTHIINYFFGLYRKHNITWHKRPRGMEMYYKPMKMWSAGFYVIDKWRVKPILDTIITSTNNKGLFTLNLIAGSGYPNCIPIQCCHNSKFLEIPPCIHSRYGILADSFVYAFGETYQLTLPLFWDAKASTNSSLHQWHVEYVHNGAYNRMRTLARLIKGCK
eukprot:gene11399-23852_t